MRIRTVAFYGLLFLGWLLAAEALDFQRNLLPTPRGILQSLGDLVLQSAFYLNIAATLRRLAIGLVIATLLGVPVGFLLGLAPSLRKYFLPLVDFFRSIPIAMLFPVFIALFGLGELSKAAMIWFFATPLLAISAMMGVLPSSEQQSYIDYLTIHRKRLGLGSYLVARAWRALPALLTGMKLAISLGLVLVIVTEMFFVANEGIGWAAYNAYEAFKLSEMYAYIFVSGLLGYALNDVFDRFSHMISSIT